MEIHSHKSHDELRQSNRLRLKCEELIKENKLEPEAKILLKARQLLQTVDSAVHSIRAAPLTVQKEQAEKVGHKFLSDKFCKNHDEEQICIEHFDGSELHLRPIDAFGIATSTADTAGVVLGLLKRGKSSSLQCDVCVVLPKNWFQDKDYLNFRYFDKRNMIAIHIARQLSQKKHRKSFSVSVVPQTSDGHKLAIVIKPSAAKKLSSNNNFHLRLILGTDGLTFPEMRYLPDRHNCRFNTNNYAVEDNGATPHYNASLAEDACYLYLTNLVREECASSKSYAEASVLFKIWQIQHAVSEEINILHLLLLLSQRKHISKNMTPLQIFILILKFITDNFLRLTNILDSEIASMDNKLLPYIDFYNYSDNQDKTVQSFITPEGIFQNDETFRNSKVEHWSFFFE